MIAKYIAIVLSLFIFLQTSAFSQGLEKVYFAGGCFWCMEESFEKVDGVIGVISGYSGGRTKNPTYKEVTYGDTGHIETIEVKYDPKKTNFKKLLDIFWVNIDPFDAAGQFCDKGYSYRSAIFYNTQKEKTIIIKSINEIEKDFEKEVVTFVKKFDKFYIAESFHQDYYKEKFLNYLIYKKNCGRVETLNKIWNK